MEPREGSRVPTFLTFVLAIAAVLSTGYWMMRGFSEEDTEALESPLMLSVARQVTDGPGDLYGPFGARNPLVLIHAPLYYRLAGLITWPLVQGGISPVTSARIAGRSLSALGFLATLAAAYGLTRLDGRSRRAGWWAVLLVAGCPLLAGQPFAVRPDTLGVALQSIGLLLTLSAMQGGARSSACLMGGYAAFGLAICVKQHLVAEAAVCTALICLNGRYNPIPFAMIFRAVGIAVGITIIVYGGEWIITIGRIWDATITAAGEVRRIHPGGRNHVSLIAYGLLRRSSGFLAFLPSVALARVGFSRGIIRGLVFVLGMILIGFFLLTLITDAFDNRLELEITLFGCALAFGPVFLLCAAIERSALLGNRVDAVLWLCLAAEIALVGILCYLSTGSWLNYSIQAAVLMAVIAARAADRAVEDTPSLRSLWPATLGAIALVFSAHNHAQDAEVERNNDWLAAQVILKESKLPPSAFFFVDRPGFNRIHGRLELVYDPWLYPVFESVHLAEPRSAWLYEALSNRSVRGIVRTEKGPVIEGTGLDLWRLGFRPTINSGPFYVWIR